MTTFIHRKDYKRGNEYYTLSRYLPLSSLSYFVLELEKQLKDLHNWPADLISLRLSSKQNGNYSRWNAAFESLPSIDVRAASYGATVSVDGRVEDKERLASSLKQLLPWRKGPFKVADVLLSLIHISEPTRPY